MRKLGDNLKHLLFKALLLGMTVAASSTVCHAQFMAPLTVSWEPPAMGGSPTGYRLYYSDSPSPPSTYTLFVDVGNSLSYTFNTDADSPSLPAGNYWFAVTAYNDVGESGYSNPMIQGATSNGLAINLQGGASAGDRSFSLELLNHNSAQSFFNGARKSDEGGHVHLPQTLRFPSLFDIRISTLGYLTKRVKGWSVDTNSTFADEELIAGDLSSPPDNRINSFDFVVFSSQFQKAGQLSDFNDDGQTNSFDFAIFTSNFNKVGD